MIQQIFFAIIVILSVVWASRQFMRVRRNILLGKDEDLSGNEAERTKENV